MKRFVITLALVFATGLTWGQDATAPKTTTHRKAHTVTKKKPAEPVVTAEDVKALRDALAAQQQQIEQLRQQLQQQQQQAADAKTAATEAANKAAAAQDAASQNNDTVTALKSDLSDVKANATTTALTLQEDQKKFAEAVESPVALHFKGITITPGGFLAAETVYRSHGTASDVNTPLNSIPFNGSGASPLSEFFGSGRQSRITLLAEGKIKTAKLTGYYETDWLSAGVTSNNNQSNSYTNRQRQIWGQVALNNGLAITGGQMWSLVTETKKGVDNRTEALPMTIDAQYHVGFSWARQFGLRVSKSFNNKIWLAASMENPQTTIGVSGAASNFVVGAPGTGGGLYNPTANYSFNYTPDFIVKAAFEPGIGHYEVFGILSNYRDRIYPNATAATPSAAGAFNSKLTGAGAGANARVTLAKKFDFGVHVLGGNGVGRYGTSSLPDVTVGPNGNLVLLKSMQGLGTFEIHTKRFDWYWNAGAEFVGKAWGLNGAGKPVGYGSPLFSNAGCQVETLPTASSGFAPGSPASCVGQTRNVIEGTFGFWFKPYNGPKGRIQFGPQYSYLVRNTWAGTGGQPQAIENMLFTSFRYYLP